MIKDKSIFFMKLILHIASLVPVVWLYWQAVDDKLGADPVEHVIHFTGIGALNLVIVTLLITPLAKKLSQPRLIKCRRLVGLYASLYAFLHLLNFVAFELQFDFALLIDEIIERPYITIGMLAFTIMFALTLTSLSSLKRRMGKAWQTLHNMIYPMALLIGIHFYWSVKSEVIEPSIYLLILVVLLYYRKKRISTWFSSLVGHR